MLAPSNHNFSTALPQFFETFYHNFAALHCNIRTNLSPLKQKSHFRRTCTCVSTHVRNVALYSTMGGLVDTAPGEPSKQWPSLRQQVVWGGLLERNPICRTRLNWIEMEATEMPAQWQWVFHSVSCHFLTSRLWILRSLTATHTHPPSPCNTLWYVVVGATAPNQCTAPLYRGNPAATANLAR